MIPGDDNRRADPIASGVWVPLTDAVAEVATLQRLVYRLVGDGKLRSRESADGEIEVWIRDDDLPSEPTGRPVNVIGSGPSTVGTENGFGHITQQLAVLIGPLVASFDRNVQLAHDNGVLSERAVSLERELKALRDATASDQRALEHATERLRALEAAHLQVTRASATRDEGWPSRQRWSWMWLAFGAFLGLAAAAVWYFGRPV